MGLTSDMLKALPEKALEHLTLIIQKIWKGEEDHEVWHTLLPMALYKEKGKTNNPNNWRGICLKELTSKVISSIVSTRLLAVISGNNVEEQFTTIGHQQAMHSLRAALSIRRAHNIDTYVLFVDLVKAYDMVNHSLLFRILKKYGIPEELVEVVERMYKDCKVHVQVGKEKRTIDYLAGV
jgi:hypothetical protein